MSDRVSAHDGSLVIWRDSVAAGDDAAAPHEWHLAVHAAATVDQVVRTIAAARYLASISTGEATWIIDGDRPIAVVAQQWPEPCFVVDPATPVFSIVRPSGRPHIEARYWSQVSPDRVLAALRAGEPLPDRYGR